MGFVGAYGFVVVPNKAYRVYRFPRLRCARASTPRFGARPPPPPNWLTLALLKHPPYRGLNLKDNIL